MKTNILGVEYRVYFDTIKENDMLQNHDGYGDLYSKEIYVRRHTKDDYDYDPVMTLPDESLEILEMKTLRHELIHAFMFESGLHVNSKQVESWATNEEMIDWFAIQMPKIIKAYEDVVRQIDKMNSIVQKEGNKK